MRNQSFWKIGKESMETRSEYHLNVNNINSEKKDAGATAEGEKKEEKKSHKQTESRRTDAEQTETMVDGDKQKKNDNTNGLIKKSPIV